MRQETITRTHWNTGRRMLTLLGGLLLLYLVTPLVYFVVTLPWRDVPGQLADAQALSALVTSVLSATLAIAITTLLGVPLAYLLARRDFPGRGLLTLLVYLPLVFPPVVS